MESQRTYIAIDLKSFYASVECVERGLDPLTTNLIVADNSRTEKTICLAVSPSLKSFGLPGRPRLFEVVQKINAVNYERKIRNNYRVSGSSYNYNELTLHPEMQVDYIVAVPRMSYYINYSTRIYQVYLKYIAPEDIHVYSIDEIFFDATEYLKTYKMSAQELTVTMIRDVLKQTGITATAGIGPNLYLCKIAMDIVAKHISADKDGVRIAELDEMSYRKKLWNHKPLTSFWRVGAGIANRLAQYGIDTMGKLARVSLTNEDFLYKLFGVNAELLIDHAWGWEPCTLQAIKQYKPESNSISSGQVLQSAYDFKKAKVVIQEMADALSLDLVSKRLVTDQLVLTVGYDTESLSRSDIRDSYNGSVAYDYYGRAVPKSSHGSINLSRKTSSGKMIVDAMTELCDRIVNPLLLVRRICVVANNVINENDVKLQKKSAVQLDLFADYEAIKKQEAEQNEELKKERRVQETLLDIKKKFGNNAILKGLDFSEGATTRERNNQIGGHKA